MKVKQSLKLGIALVVFSVTLLLAYSNCAPMKAAKWTGSVAESLCEKPGKFQQCTLENASYAQQLCTESRKWSACEAVTCANGYELNSNNLCVKASCTPGQSRDCVGNFGKGQMTCGMSRTWGTCELNVCDDAEFFTLSNKQCNQSKDCTRAISCFLENGMGQRQCKSDKKFGECVAKDCNAGFTPSGTSCQPSACSGGSQACPVTGGSGTQRCTNGVWGQCSNVTCTGPTYEANPGKTMCNLVTCTTATPQNCSDNKGTAARACVVGQPPGACVYSACNTTAGYMNPPVNGQCQLATTCSAAIPCNEPTRNGVFEKPCVSGVPGQYCQWRSCNANYYPVDIPVNGTTPATVNCQLPDFSVVPSTNVTDCRDGKGKVGFKFSILPGKRARIKVVEKPGSTAPTDADIRAGTFLGGANCDRPAGGDRMTFKDFATTGAAVSENCVSDYIVTGNTYFYHWVDDSQQGAAIKPSINCGAAGMTVVTVPASGPLEKGSTITYRVTNGVPGAQVFIQVELKNGNDPFRIVQASAYSGKNIEANGSVEIYSGAIGDVGDYKVTLTAGAVSRVVSFSVVEPQPVAVEFTHRIQSNVVELGTNLRLMVDAVLPVGRERALKFVLFNPVAGSNQKVQFWSSDQAPGVVYKTDSAGKFNQEIGAVTHHVGEWKLDVTMGTTTRSIVFQVNGPAVKPVIESADREIDDWGYWVTLRGTGWPAPTPGEPQRPWLRVSGAGCTYEINSNPWYDSVEGDKRRVKVFMGQQPSQDLRCIFTVSNNGQDSDPREVTIPGPQGWGASPTLALIGAVTQEGDLDVAVLGGSNWPAAGPTAIEKVNCPPNFQIDASVDQAEPNRRAKLKFTKSSDDRSCSVKIGSSAPVSFQIPKRTSSGTGGGGGCAGNPGYGGQMYTVDTESRCIDDSWIYYPQTQCCHKKNYFECKADYYKPEKVGYNGGAGEPYGFWFDNEGNRLPCVVRFDTCYGTSYTPPGKWVYPAEPSSMNDCQYSYGRWRTQSDPTNERSCCVDKDVSNEF